MNKMSRKRPTESSWDSDEDLLGEDVPGTTAFRDEDIDEDALLGVSDDEEMDAGVVGENISEIADTSYNEQSQPEPEEEEVFDVVVDEDEDAILGIESNSEFEDSIYSQHSDANRSQNHDTSVNHPEPPREAAPTHTQQHTEHVETHHMDSSYTQDDAVDDTEDTTTSGRAAAADEDEEEEESDDEDKRDRGRFRSERSDTVKIKRERASIPDTLELSAEEQARIDEIENRIGSRHHRGHRGRYRGNRGGQQGFRHNNNMGGPRGMMGPRPHQGNMGHNMGNMPRNQFQPRQGHPQGHPQGQYQQRPMMQPHMQQQHQQMLPQQQQSQMLQQQQQQQRQQQQQNTLLNTPAAMAVPVKPKIHINPHFRGNLQQTVQPGGYTAPGHPALLGAAPVIQPPPQMPPTSMPQHSPNQLFQQPQQAPVSNISWSGGPSPSPVPSHQQPPVQQPQPGFMVGAAPRQPYPPQPFQPQQLPQPHMQNQIRPQEEEANSAKKKERKKRKKRNKARNLQTAGTTFSGETSEMNVPQVNMRPPQTQQGPRYNFNPVQQNQGPPQNFNNNQGGFNNNNNNQWNRGPQGPGLQQQQQPQPQPQQQYQGGSMGRPGPQMIRPQQHQQQQQQQPFQPMRPQFEPRQQQQQQRFSPPRSQHPFRSQAPYPDTSSNQRYSNPQQQPQPPRFSSPPPPQQHSPQQAPAVRQHQPGPRPQHHQQHQQQHRPQQVAQSHQGGPRYTAPHQHMETEGEAQPIQTLVGGTPQAGRMVKRTGSQPPAGQPPQQRQRPAGNQQQQQQQQQRPAPLTDEQKKLALRRQRFSTSGGTTPTAPAKLQLTANNQLTPNRSNAQNTLAASKKKLVLAQRQLHAAAQKRRSIEPPSPTASPTPPKQARIVIQKSAPVPASLPTRKVVTAQPLTPTKAGTNTAEAMLDADLAAKLEQQKQIRERIKRQKEANRQAQAADRRATLVQTLTERGESLEDIADGIASFNPEAQVPPQHTPPVQQVPTSPSFKKPLAPSHPLPQPLQQRQLARGKKVVQMTKTQIVNMQSQGKNPTIFNQGPPVPLQGQGQRGRGQGRGQPVMRGRGRGRGMNRNPTIQNVGQQVQGQGHPVPFRGNQEQPFIINQQEGPGPQPIPTQGQPNPNQGHPRGRGGAMNQRGGGRGNLNQPGQGGVQTGNLRGRGQQNAMRRGQQRFRGHQNQGRGGMMMTQQDGLMGVQPGVQRRHSQEQVGPPPPQQPPHQAPAPPSNRTVLAHSAPIQGQKHNITQGHSQGQSAGSKRRIVLGGGGDLGMAADTVVIHNLSRSTAPLQVQQLTGQVGPITNLDMTPQGCFISFNDPAHAMQFQKRFNRHMVDLSHITVNLVPK